MSLTGYQNPYVVSMASVDERATFIRRTYAHLAGAIGVFAILVAMLMSIPGIEDTVFGLLAISPYSWLVVLGLFMAASWVADKWARSDTSRGMQYAGLALYVVAEAFIFLPLLLMAKAMTGDTSLIAQAGFLTLVLFLGLTFVALTTRKDFSFLGGILKVGGILALGLIVAAIFFGFSLGLWFSGAMVLLAAGSVLYTTGNMIHHYRTNQYVAASLGLFAAVALMFWYILRILMSLRR